VGRNGAERQRDHRKRRKESGRYINVFVPHKIGEKLRGNPSMLVERFFDFSRLDDRIKELEKEITGLRVTLGERVYRLVEKRKDRWMEEVHGKTAQDLLDVFRWEGQRLSRQLMQIANEHEHLQNRFKSFRQEAMTVVDMLTKESKAYLPVIGQIYEQLRKVKGGNAQEVTAAVEKMIGFCDAATKKGVMLQERNKKSYDALFREST